MLGDQHQERWQWWVGQRRQSISYVESAFTTLCRVQMTTEISIGMDSALDRGGAVAIVVRVKQTFYQLREGLQGPEVNVRRG